VCASVWALVSATGLYVVWKMKSATVFQKRRSDRKNFDVSAQRKVATKSLHFLTLSLVLDQTLAQRRAWQKAKSKSEVTHWSHWWRWGGTENVKKSSQVLKFIVSIAE